MLARRVRALMFKRRLSKVKDNKMKIGYGTIQGSAHRKLDYNNQDAVLVFETDELLIGLVADGCGSGANSEVGAQLAVKRVAKIIDEKIKLKSDWKTDLKKDLQAYSRTIAHLHDTSVSHFVKDYLLYTLVGFVKYRDRITVFSCGDGVIVIDDNIQIIDQNNQPKYLNNELNNSQGAEFQFQEFKYEGQKILIGSDGVEDIIAGIDNKLIPEYLSFNDLMCDEANYYNPVQLPKLLQKYSKKNVLVDDCTLIMLKE